MPLTTIFAVSRFAEVLDFPDDCFGRQAAAFATDEGITQ